MNVRSASVLGEALSRWNVAQGEQRRRMWEGKWRPVLDFQFASGALHTVHTLDIQTSITAPGNLSSFPISLLLLSFLLQISQAVLFWMRITSVFPPVLIHLPLSHSSFLSFCWSPTPPSPSPSPSNRHDRSPLRLSGKGEELYLPHCSLISLVVDRKERGNKRCSSRSRSLSFWCLFLSDGTASCMTNDRDVSQSRGLNSSICSSVKLLLVLKKKSLPRSTALFHPHSKSLWAGEALSPDVHSSYFPDQMGERAYVRILWSAATEKTHRTFASYTGN